MSYYYQLFTEAIKRRASVEGKDQTEIVEIALRAYLFPAWAVANRPVSVQEVQTSDEAATSTTPVREGALSLEDSSDRISQLALEVDALRQEVMALKKSIQAA